jgi:hypothetical protein
MTSLEFEIDVNLLTGEVKKGNKTKKLPFEKSLNQFILPLRIMKKYHYCNVNAIILLPNYMEFLYNNVLYPVSKLDFEPNDYEKEMADYMAINKMVMEQIDTYPIYGTIISENNDLYISDLEDEIDINTFKVDKYQRITNIIPDKFLETKQFGYYYEYCQKNNIELFGILNEVFQINFKNLDITLN